LKRSQCSSNIWRKVFRSIPPIFSPYSQSTCLSTMTSLISLRKNANSYTIELCPCCESALPCEGHGPCPLNCHLFLNRGIPSKEYRALIVVSARPYPFALRYRSTNGVVRPSIPQGERKYIDCGRNDDQRRISIFEVLLSLPRFEFPCSIFDIRNFKCLCSGFTPCALHLAPYTSHTSIFPEAGPVSLGARAP
jgi:hypothetical protein